MIPHYPHNTGFKTIKPLSLRSIYVVVNMIHIKLFFVLVLLAILGGVNTVQSQIIKGEAILGLNLTQVDGDEVYGFKRIGANLGAGAMIPFAKNWDVSIEATFNQKGAYQKEQYPGDSLNGAYKLRLNYAEVPVIVHYTDKNFISAGLGFSWGRLVGVNEWEHGLKTATSLNSGTYAKDDFAAIFDVRLRILGPLLVNVRYQYSLAKIRTRDFYNLAGDTWTRDQFNNVISFRLIYMFNEKQSKRVLKRSDE